MPRTTRARGRRTADTARGAFRIRRAVPTDLATLVDHRHRMFEEIGGWTLRELERADPTYRRWFVRERAARRLLAFVAEDPRRRVLGSGALWLQPCQPRPGRLARTTMPYLLSMYTEPEARGRGVASSLVRAMVDWARAHGYRRVFLHASPFGRSVYAGLGFAPGNEMRLDLPAHARRRRRSRGRAVRAP